MGMSVEVSVEGRLALGAVRNTDEAEELPSKHQAEVLLLATVSP